jgi:hypothetical protein
VPVALVDVATGEARQVAFGWSASWSHDGAEFAFADSDGLFVGTPAAATARLVRPGGVGFSAISPSRDRIAFVRGKRVRILHRASRREVLLKRSDAGHDAPSWSIRGQRAFVAAGPCGRRSQIDVVRADGSGRRVLVRAFSFVRARRAGDGAVAGLSRFVETAGRGVLDRRFLVGVDCELIRRR